MLGPDGPESPQFLRRAGSPALAYRHLQGSDESQQRPGLVWLGGFKSDMQSTKAQRIADWARTKGLAFTRFDYSGHGESQGEFVQGTIGAWFADALAIIQNCTKGPQILIGSSMGGWITLLIARHLAQTGQAERLAGLVLIAPAVDFTQALLLPRLPDSARQDLATKGVWYLPSPYAEEPTPITQGLLEDGAKHLLLGAPIRSFCPVHILQGMQDPDVPYAHALTLVEHLASDPVTLTLIKDGDHRLSRDQDIAQLLQAIDRLSRA
jgi:pimeloyl-ACP methyl ester carboxylesterase